MSTVLAFGDTHSPFMHADTVPFLSEVAGKYNPHEIVHIGDVADFHYASRWNKHQMNSSQRERMESAHALEDLTSRFPKVKVCRGNHDNRINDRLNEIGIPLEVCQSLNVILGLPKGWRWADDWEIDGVIYEHGENYSGKEAHCKAARENLQNTVVGHVHAHAGIQFIECRRRNLWGMNIGCLINQRAYAFEYAKKSHAPVVGCGIIVDGVAQFLPMRMDGRKRWTGSL